MYAEIEGTSTEYREKWRYGGYSEMTEEKMTRESSYKEYEGVTTIKTIDRGRSDVYGWDSTKEEGGVYGLWS